MLVAHGALIALLRIGKGANRAHPFRAAQMIPKPHAIRMTGQNLRTLPWR
jgi:hypothetical protein